MPSWALFFLIVALVAVALGFSGIALGAAWLARTLFFVLLLLFAAVVAVRRPTIR